MLKLMGKKKVTFLCSNILFIKAYVLVFNQNILVSLYLIMSLFSQAGIRGLNKKFVELPHSFFI